MSSEGKRCVHGKAYAHNCVPCLRAEVERLEPLEAALSRARRNVWEMEAEVERLRSALEQIADGTTPAAAYARAALADEEKEEA